MHQVYILSLNACYYHRKVLTLIFQSMSLINESLTPQKKKNAIFIATKN